MIRQLRFLTQKIHANNYSYVWRREETRRVRFARSWTQASNPHFIWYFFLSSIRAQRDTYIAAVCTLGRYVATKDARWAAALLGLEVRARVDRQLAAVWLRKGAATAFAHCGCIRSPTHRSLLVLSCVPCAAGSAQFDFDLIK